MVLKKNSEIDPETNELIFERLKNLLVPYSPPLIIVKESQSKFELWSDKEIFVNNKKKSGMFFASVVKQKNFVGFYFFPIYTHKTILVDLNSELLKLLKGKSCFHLKNIEESILKKLKTLIQKGFKIYKKDHWI